MFIKNEGFILDVLVKELENSLFGELVPVSSDIPFVREALITLAVKHGYYIIVRKGEQYYDNFSKRIKNICNKIVKEYMPEVDDLELYLHYPNVITSNDVDQLPEGSKCILDIKVPFFLVPKGVEIITGFVEV